MSRIEIKQRKPLTSSVALLSISHRQNVATFRLHGYVTKPKPIFNVDIPDAIDPFVDPKPH